MNFTKNKVKNLIILSIVLPLISCSFDSKNEVDMNQIINNALQNVSKYENNSTRESNDKIFKILGFAELNSGMSVLNLGQNNVLYNELLENILVEQGEGSFMNLNFEKMNSIENTFDRVFMIENYHTLYSDFAEPKTDAVQELLEKVSHTLNPGGLVIIIDHDAEKGSTISTASSINRLSDEIVMSDMKNAGFQFVDNIHILKDDWEDDLTISAFDPSVIGSTSRFVHKYRNPN